MKKAFLLSLCVLAACDRPAADDTLAGDTAVIDTAAAAADTDTAGAPMRRATAPTQFDARTVKRGARFGELTVAAVDLQPAAIGPKMSGTVRFSGDIQLVGNYRAHFDYPEVNEPCFWVDMGSWPKVPRATGDERIIWFCFSNEAEAIRQLGALGTQARATIVIADYTTALSGSDAWDTARLVRVLSKESF